MVGTGGPPDIISSSPEYRSSSTWITGRHDFKITGYSLNKGIGVGKSITSDTFTVGGYSWHITFYPDGNAEKAVGYVSVFLTLSSTAKNVEVTFGMMIIDQSGGESHKVGRSSGAILYNPSQKGWGWDQFMKQTDLETSPYLECDGLHIRCHIGVTQSVTERNKFHSPPQIGQHLGKLLESGEKTDVNFEVAGEIISAHKLLLAARSPVFAALLYGPMKEQNDQYIKIEDIEADIFKALLHFIYCDVLPDCKEFGSILNGKSTVMFQHLLVAADRYCLDRLKMLCMVKLCDHISAGNVARTLVVADQCKATLLKSVCLEFAVLPQNIQAVLRSADFKYLKETCPNVCVELLHCVAKIKDKHKRCPNGARGWVKKLTSFFTSVNHI